MRAEFQTKIDHYQAALRAADPEQIAPIREEFNRWYNERTDLERDEMKPYWDENLRQVKEGLKEVRKMIEKIQRMDEKEKRKKQAKAAA
jgi:hypothetical protein